MKFALCVCGGGGGAPRAHIGRASSAASSNCRQPTAWMYMYMYPQQRLATSGNLWHPALLSPYHYTTLRLQHMPQKHHAAAALPCKVQRAQMPHSCWSSIASCEGLRRTSTRAASAVKTQQENQHACRIIHGHSQSRYHCTCAVYLVSMQQVTSMAPL
jgi:hypothetical protein